ncbi:LLM class flavin-dependent oxidoreductase [Arthrobacter sp. JZ12]|uniref:LLM class flavin-dependent oxidoreductase n=1 Tax=Arthrobacter sp. JZ12 TaxID=2654190 RepID=UPI002B49133A|nr:LLM class flavin-dependent oxidoreductase [Arthrobacter sp. JZ12]
MSTSTSFRVPLSVLDLATVGSGKTSSDALADSARLAEAADRLGFTRFWVAEHHNMPSVASTSPAVLIAHLAARTERIRLGSGGVMLPNHAPFVVAEQFALLEALHPGRIDLGIGRAPGTDQMTALALRRQADGLGVEEFPQHVLEVLALLGDNRTPDRAVRLVATPSPSSFPDVWLLGSSGYSAQLAGMLGLRYSYAHHFGNEDPAAIMRLYRSNFQPSPALQEPYAMLATSALTAETEEEAQYLAGPSRIMALSLRSGHPAPIVSPEEAAKRVLTEQEEFMLQHLPAIKAVGTPEQVTARLDELIRLTGVQEVMVTGTTYDVGSRIDSLVALAETWRAERAERPVESQRAEQSEPAAAGTAPAAG